jgi:DNA-directed RNA polymerase subunit RPC12/RpoP
MDLFSITCTTCKSRLKVRDQAAIGQILACPKCGGMVMVKPPPTFEDATDQKSDLATATEVMPSAGPRFDQTLHSSAFDMLEELLSDSPPKVQTPPATAAASPASSATVPASATPANATPVPAGPPKPRFVGGPPAHRTPAAAGTPAKPRATPSTPLSPLPPAKAPAPIPAAVTASNGQAPVSTTRDTVPLAPPPPAESEVSKPASAEAPTARRGQALWMAGSVGLGAVLAIAAVAAILYFRQPAKLAATPGKLTATTPAPSTTKHDQAAQPDLATSAPSSSSTTVPPDPWPNEPAAASSTNATAASPPVDPSTTPRATDTGDPLGLVKQPDKSPAAPGGNSLAPFDRLIGGAADDPLAKTTNRPPSPAPALPSDLTPARPLAPRPPPREVDVARRLADPLTAIETAGTPLADFLQLMSDLSTIPITLEMEALPFAPASAESKVVLKAENTTVGKALAAALTRMRLEYVITSDQLLVRRTEDDPVKPLDHPVNDLTGGDAQQMTELIELLQAIAEPAAWSEGEGAGSITADAASGTLTITHRRAVQAQVLFAIEKLRTARTPPLAHRLKLDASQFVLDSRWSKARPRLETPISLTYSQPTRLLTILERLGEAAGVRILVDWHDVASAGWNPAAEATLVANKQPLSAALDALLGPLDLTWRVIDGQTLQVVTPVRLASQGELEFYKVDDLATASTSGEALVARIRAALGDDALAEGAGEVRYSAEGKCLLAWLPQLKQRELESLLTKWRGESARK